MISVLAAVVNGWWQGIVLTLLVWLLLRELRRVSAATKLAIWQVTLAIVILLPALQQIPGMMGPAASKDPAVTTATRVLPTRHISPQPIQLASRLPEYRATAPVIEVSDHQAPAMLVGIAALLACFQLLRLLMAYRAVRRLKREAVPANLDLPLIPSRAIDVLMTRNVCMPMAAGYRHPAILLPASLSENLTPEEMRFVLLHEAAHIQRNDDWMKLAERVVRAVFCFQPAVYWIGRQMEREREMACDDWVIARSGETKPYANSLARLAELASSGSVPVLAMGAGRRKAIFVRLEAMFDRAGNRMPVVSESAVIVAGVLLMLAVFQGAQFSHLLGFTNFSSRSVESDGTHRREIKMRGDIDFSANDQDVQSMSPDALLVVEQSDDFRSWRIEFEPDQDGVIQRRYFTGHVQRPFDAEARRRLSIALPAWVREQGKNVPERLARLLKDKGVDGAVEDIRSIRSSGVKREYLEELALQAHLTPDQLARTLKLAAGMDSDDDKLHFIESVMEIPSLGEMDFTLPLLACIDSMHSDEDKRKLLVELLERKPIDATLLARVARSVGQMPSDSDKTEILLRESKLAATALPEAFFDAAGSIHDDNDRERLLSSVLQMHSDQPKTVAQVFRNAGAMASDEAKTGVIVAAAREISGSDTLAEASRVLNSIHGGDNRRRALEALLAANGTRPEILNEVLSQTLRMESEDDKSHVLLQVAGTFPEQEPVRRAFFVAVNTLHSSEHRRQVLMAFAGRPHFTPEDARELSQAALRIDSQDDQAAVLKAVAERSNTK